MNRHRLLRVLPTAIVALALFALPTAAHAESTLDYSYWYAFAQTRVFPTTLPPLGSGTLSAAAQPLAIQAAQAEYEGRQIAIRPMGAPVQNLWIDPSDLTLLSATGAPAATITSANVTAFKVDYVNISAPSYGFRRTGPLPDPLIPMTLANGERLGWTPGGGMNLARRGAAADTTQPFYVLFHVPNGSPAGVYTGTLRITGIDSSGAPLRELVLPVSLTVYPFSVQARTLKTSFGLRLFDAMKAGSPSGTWLDQNANPGPGATRIAERTTNHTDQVYEYLRFMSDHRVSPQTIEPAWGNITASGFLPANRSMLDDFLGSGARSTNFAGSQLNFNTVMMPEYVHKGWLRNPFGSSSSTSRAITYYRSMRDQLGADAPRAYVYPIDEPSAKMRPLVEKYATLIHRYVPGVKFLLTTDATTQKNKLLKGVDIYVYKLHFAFRDSAWYKQVRKTHKEYWIYSHATNWSPVTPSLLLDAPVTDSRIQPWMAWKLRASGLLYFGINKWTKPGGMRDPYVDFNTGKTYKGRPFNDDGMLVYPGYYPARGLYVEGAAPVSSLRMEAMRDGLEDYEYLTQIAARYGTPKADAYAGALIGRAPKAKAGRLIFPPYSKNEGDFEAVRAQMGALLSQ